MANDSGAQLSANANSATPANVFFITSRTASVLPLRRRRSVIPITGCFAYEKTR